MNIILIFCFLIRGFIPSLGFEEHGFNVPDGYNAAVVTLYTIPGKFAALDFYDGTLIGCAVSTDEYLICESRTVVFPQTTGNYLAFSVVGDPEQDYILKIEWQHRTYLPFVGEP